MRARPSSLLLSVLVGSAFGVTPAVAQTPSCPDARPLTRGLTLPLSAVRYLADDALEGRLAGSRGEACAGDFLAAEFKRLRLAPGGDDAGYFQDVALASVLNPHAAGGTGRNVIGLLPGRDATLGREWIVIGAHYDHLGRGGNPSSLSPGEDAVHNGADDNASGVAALLRVAERLTRGPRLARSVAFVAFTGEESGLLGSAHFANHPTLGPGTTTAMINMDMVGRLGNGSLIVYGVDTADEWRRVVDTAAAASKLAVATRGECYGPSDHTSFYLKDIPVLHLFTNTHADYHKPGDDWTKIDGTGLEAISGLVERITRSIADRRQTLTLRRGAGEPPRPAGAATGGYGAYLGSVPDFSPVERGVKLGGVTPGSPGDKGGLKAGDVIVGLGTFDVADLQAMTDALRAYKPGEVVAIRFLRDGAPQSVEVTLGSRAAR